MPKILYFEDDTTLAGMFKIKMEREGIEVIYREYPPQDPVTFVLEQKPDLVFTDTLMPKMDGFTLIHLLKGDARTKDIPIFCMSNLSQKEEVDKIISLGAVDYWINAKHTPTEVAEKIKKIIAGDRSSDASSSTN